jgi:hypothetical protein
VTSKRLVCAFLLFLSRSVDLLVDPGATVLQLSTTVTETIISTPMQEVEGRLGVT